MTIKEITGLSTSPRTPHPLLLPSLLSAFDRPLSLSLSLSSSSVGPGGYHTIALTSEGQVYSWGHNRVGQLGYSINQNMSKNHEGAYFLPTPQLVPLPLLAEHYSLIDRQDILDEVTATAAPSSSNLTHSFGDLQSTVEMKHVVAGWGHSCLITVDGVGYVCGRNQHGQLGLGEPKNFPLNERNHHYQPYFIPLKSLIRHQQPIPLAHVSCGGEHSVFITSSNEIYSTGRGHKGQLGHGNHLDCSLPKKVEYFSTLQRHVHQVTCGNSATLYLIGKYCEPVTLVERCIQEWNRTMAELSSEKRGEERGREREIEMEGGGGKEEEEEEEERKRRKTREIFNRNTTILRTILPPHQSLLLREWRQDD
jgi:hypothetical protein